MNISPRSPPAPPSSKLSAPTPTTPEHQHPPLGHMPAASRVRAPWWPGGRVPKAHLILNNKNRSAKLTIVAEMCLITRNPDENGSDRSSGEEVGPRGVPVPRVCKSPGSLRLSSFYAYWDRYLSSCPSPPGPHAAATGPGATPSEGTGKAGNGGQRQTAAPSSQERKCCPAHVTNQHRVTQAHAAMREPRDASLWPKALFSGRAWGHHQRRSEQNADCVQDGGQVCGEAAVQVLQNKGAPAPPQALKNHSCGLH